MSLICRRTMRPCQTESMCAPWQGCADKPLVSSIGTEAKVCHDIYLRQQKGIFKYGTTVEKNPLPLREWLQHAYEECLDQAVYLKRAMDEMDKREDDLK